MTALLQDRKLKQLLLIAVFAKIAVILAVILAFSFFPFCTACHDANFHYPSNEKASLQTAFKTWDAQHFLYLAENWYSEGRASNAFYPLYPFLAGVFSFIAFGNFLAAGLALSFVFSIIAVVFLYLLVKRLFNEKTAFLSGIFFIAFPTAFFLSLPYAEALFMALVLGFFYFLFEKKFAFAAVFAFLLPLSKPQGIIVALPLAVFIVQDFFASKKFKALISKEFLKKSALLALLFCGFFAYLSVMQFSTGDAFAGFKAEKAWGRSVSVIFNPSEWLDKSFLNAKLALHNYYYSILDRLFFIAFLVLLYFIFRLLPRPFFVYSLAFGVLPVLTSVFAFASFPRYLLLVFPIFIVLALKFEKKPWLVLVPSILLQAVLLAMHALNYWAA